MTPHDCLLAFLFPSKRTKAEVDKGKLKQIEQQDAQLARIIHEQDKLKAKKARQRRQKSEEEARRQVGSLGPVYVQGCIHS